MAENLKGFAQQHLPAVDEAVISFLKQTIDEPELLASMTYSLTAGGKRIRPLLLLGTLNFLGQPLKREHYQVAGALEMIHTYSLIHDDLPAMDNDELRRGQPTNHVLYGEALAILAGDGLLTEAFHLISQSDLGASSKVTVLQNLASAAGARGMIAGQVADMAGEKQQLTLAALQEVHRRKTGALIEFAVVTGANLSHQGQPVLSALTTYARHFGIAFQIKDDLLDVLGDEALIGKKTGGDAALNKSTYVSLLGVSGAKTALKTHYAQGLLALEQAKELLTITEQDTLLEQLLATLTV